MEKASESRDAVAENDGDVEPPDNRNGKPAQQSSQDQDSNGPNVEETKNEQDKSHESLADTSIKPESRKISPPPRSCDSMTPCTTSGEMSGFGDDSADNDHDHEDSEVYGQQDPAIKKRKKLDRSKLRKGKWTIEEEEYTSRIIHYFSIGLLTLPEGATLRSYIADKLNCDPMRVTKKYAGASCLGRRVFQVRDRPQPTLIELQLAKTELDVFERRFKQRVEEGRPGVPLPQQFDVALALAQQQQLGRGPPAAGLASLLSMNESSAQTSSPLNGSLGALSVQAFHSLIQGINQGPGSSMLSQPLAFNSASQSNFFGTAPAPAISNNNNLQVDAAIAQLLLAKIAASGGNQINPPSPLPVSFNLPNTDALKQQARQEPLSATSNILSSASMQSLLSSVSIQNPPLSRQESVTPSTQPTPGLNIQTLPSSSKPNPNIFLEELKRTYEQHLASQVADNGPSAPYFNEHKASTVAGNAAGRSAAMQAVQTTSRTDNGPSVPHFPSDNARRTSAISPSRRNKTGSTEGHQLAPKIRASNLKAAVKPAIKPLPVQEPQSSQSVTTTEPKTKKVKVIDSATAPSQTREDGAIMMGFLSSLRSSFESAIAQQEAVRAREQQEDSEETNSSTSGPRRRPATVTDSSSQQQESCSSVDESDWNSEDKKTDSSEDSDKDEERKKDNYLDAVQYSKGPPRKRHKSKKVEGSLVESRAE